MSSKEEFRAASESMQSWVMDLSAVLGSEFNAKRRSRDETFNLMEMLGEISSQFPGLHRLLFEWEDRVIAADSSGSTAIVTFVGFYKDATAHGCIGTFLDDLTIRLSGFVEKNKLPEDFDAWSVRQVQSVNNWLAAEKSIGEEASDITCRMQREMVKACGPNSKNQGTKRNDQPTNVELGIIRDVMRNMSSTKPTVEAVRVAIRKAGYKIGNKKISNKNIEIAKRMIEQKN